MLLNSVQTSIRQSFVHVKVFMLNFNLSSGDHVLAMCSCELFGFAHAHRTLVTHGVARTFG